MASLLTDDQLKQLRSIFALIDSDNNGKLNSHELTLIVNSFGKAVSEQEIEDVISQIDVGPTGGDGRVDFEVCAHCRHSPSHLPLRLQEFCTLFVRRFDHDKKVGFSKTEDVLLALVCCAHGSCAGRGEGSICDAGRRDQGWRADCRGSQEGVRCDRCVDSAWHKLC